jgi:hypothetical protein
MSVVSKQTAALDLKSKMMQEIKEEIITKRQFLRGETIFCDLYDETYYHHGKIREIETRNRPQRSLRSLVFNFVARGFRKLKTLSNDLIGSSIMTSTDQRHDILSEKNLCCDRVSVACKIF